jgi:ABC-2 type transport system ATP-binding protein
MSDDRTSDLMVDIRGLWVYYGKQAAVQNLTLQIPRGEVFGFIGPNGAGKTTTIKVLATLLKPGSGTVLVDGINVWREPHTIRKNIGYVPDFFGVYEDLTVNEYLHFFAAAYRLPTEKRQGVINDVLSLTDLVEKREAMVDTLSRGMKQRLGIARVLIHDPKLLLLDEPASGLDPRARIELRELIKELRGMGKTIIVSSHILHELSQFCTRIGIIEAGKFVAQGSLDDIYRQLNFKRVIHVMLANQTEAMIEGIRGIDGVASVDLDVDRL